MPSLKVGNLKLGKMEHILIQSLTLLCALFFLKKLKIFQIFFFKLYSAIKLVAFDLEDGFGTIVKLFL